MTVARALGCLLLALGPACDAPKPSLVKAQPSSQPLPVPVPVPVPARSPTSTANCSQPDATRLNAVDLKPGPATQPLGAQLGLWLADERSALLDAKPDPAWAEGPISEAGPNSATRAVSMTRLPKALRAWLGRPVKVLGASGAVCETRLQRFFIRAQIKPDLRTAEHWEGCSDAPAIAPSARSEEIWRLTRKAGRTLIAEFSTPCKGALLAIDPSLPAPVTAAPELAAAEVGDQAMTAFRQLPEYAQIQARFHNQQPASSGSWDDREARRSISTLALPGHTPLFMVSEQVGSGCASDGEGFSASLSALWGGGGPAVAVAAIDDRKLTPSAIVDLGGSGGGAILLGPDGPWAARSVLRAKANTDQVDVTRFERVFLSSVPYFPEPC